MENRQYILLMHLSQFAGYIIPLAGLIAPIIMWSQRKDEDYEVDLHGRIIINWLITAFVLAIIGVMLSIIIVGIPLLIALGICAIVFPILGAVKSSENEVWIYPMSLDVMGVKDRMGHRF